MTGSPNRGAAGESGSGSIWVLSMLLILAVLVVASTAAAAAVAGRTAAGAAADLAALAAADSLQHRRSAATACAVARTIAARNDAELVSCAVRSDIVLVRVQRVLSGRYLASVHVQATARAGPF